MLERYLALFGYRLGLWKKYLLWQLRNIRSSNRLARPGTVFVCPACGKRSHDKYGTLAIDDGWDESCMMHAQLCVDRSLIFGDNGRVAKAIAA